LFFINNIHTQVQGDICRMTAFILLMVIILLKKFIYKAPHS